MQVLVNMLKLMEQVDAVLEWANDDVLAELRLKCVQPGHAELANSLVAMRQARRAVK